MLPLVITSILSEDAPGFHSGEFHLSHKATECMPNGNAPEFTSGDAYLLRDLPVGIWVKDLQM